VNLEASIERFIEASHHLHKLEVRLPMSLLAFMPVSVISVRLYAIPLALPSHSAIMLYRLITGQ